MMPFYKPPILTVIFRIVGVLFLLASIVAAIVTLRQVAATGEGAEPGQAAWNALGTVAVGLLALLFYWGVAQAIDFLGRTAFFTEQLYVQGATGAGVRGKAARALVSSDSYDADDAEADDTEAETPAPPTRPAPAVERTKFACKACGQRISAMTSEIGNHIACPNCGEDVTVS